MVGNLGYAPSTPGPQPGVILFHQNPHIFAHLPKGTITINFQMLFSFKCMRPHYWYLILVTLQAQVVYETSLCS